MGQLNSLQLEIEPVHDTEPMPGSITGAKDLSLGRSYVLGMDYYYSAKWR